MCEIKIENKSKMIAAMGVITEALCCHPQRVANTLEDIEEYRICGFETQFDRTEREIVICALKALQVLQDCESIQLNFGEEK